MSKKFIFIFTSILSLSFVLTLYTVVKFDIDFITHEKLELYLMILGLMTTFGGAYLGAKIAGEFSAKISKFERDEINNRHFKKGKFIKEDFVKECDEIIERFRNKDIVGKITVKGEDIWIVSDFKDSEYERVDDDYIARVDQMVHILNDYRVSDSFFYLEDTDIKHINSIVKELNDIYSKLKILNKFFDEGVSQNDGIFKKKVEELGFALIRYYDLVKKN